MLPPLPDQASVICFCRIEDCIARSLDKVVIHCNFKTYVRDQVRNDDLSTVNFFRYTSTMARYMVYGDPGDGCIDQGLAYLVELIFSYDCYHYVHDWTLCLIDRIKVAYG